MARSSFIQNTSRPAALRAQFRKLKDDLRGSGLMLEEPFQDQSGAVELLCGDVESRMKYGGFSNAAHAAIVTLAPQNLSPAERSWLDVPFIIPPERSGGAFDCAGAVACAETSDAGSGPVREVDMEGITLLGVSVLRRLGIPAFFSYLHFDNGNPRMQEMHSLSIYVGSVPFGDPVPAVLTLNPEPELFAFVPPYAIPFPAHVSVSGFEVLDDSAVHSLIQVKMAFEQAIRLMRDVSDQRLESEAEGEFRAMCIAHALHEGMRLWSVEDAWRDMDAAAALNNPARGAPGVESVRLHAEAKYVHELLCPEHHSMLATSVILSEETKMHLADAAIRLMGNEGLIDGGHAMPPMQDQYLARLMEYMRLSEILQAHIHAQDECPDKIRIN
ncbi:hypothetical protein L0Y65_01085 [Candidatus Micrarchaeota archaeon]|nr:hypothetical protein [Candidatus Micrarchaeota archaeon]